MLWTRKGFVIASEVHCDDGEFMPLLHKFMKTEWEAKAAKEEAGKLPEDLRVELRIIQATLTFEMTPKERSAGTNC